MTLRFTYMALNSHSNECQHCQIATDMNLLEQAFRDQALSGKLRKKRSGFSGRLATVHGDIVAMSTCAQEPQGTK